MKKSELLTQLNNQIDCVFTLAQVKTLIEGLENENTFDVDKVYNDIESCIRKEVDSIDDSDLVNEDDIDFYLDGREICVQNVSIDYSSIRKAVREGLDEWKNRLEASFVNLG